MRCLEAELWVRKKGGDQAFMQNLETWINGRTWQQYEHMVDLSNARKRKEKYGEKLI